MTTSSAVPEPVVDEPTRPYVLDDEDEARCLYLVEYATQGDAEAATCLATALARFVEPEKREAARRFLRAEARRRGRGAELEDLDAMLTRARTKP